MSSITAQTAPRGRKYAAGAERRAHAPAPSILRHAARNVGFGEVLAEYKNALESKNDKPHTVDTNLSHLKRLGKWLDEQGLGLADLREPIMDRYIAHRTSVDIVGDITRRRDGILAKALMKFAARRGFVARNYLLDWTLPKAEKPYRKMPSPNEQWRLLSAVADKCKAENNPCRRHRNWESQRFFTARDQAIIAVAICTGLRVSEIFALLPDDYDRQNRQLAVRHSKSGRPRYVAVEDDLLAYLDTWVAVRPDESVLRAQEWWQGEDERGMPKRPTLFVTEGGTKMLQNAWGRQFRRYCERAGVEGITFHCLRHYAGTQVLHIDAIAAKNQMGHSELRTTMGYHHNDAEHIREAVLRARPLGKVIDSGKPTRRRSLILP